MSTHSVRTGSGAAVRRHNASLLDEGTLYVARFRACNDTEFDGAGEWLALTSGTESFVEGLSPDEVYVRTRLAADKTGATTLDRTSDVAVSPQTGSVFVVTLGKIFEITESGTDGAATTFQWRLSLTCCDPDDPDADHTRPCPYTVAVDRYGTLWFTDGELFCVSFGGPLHGQVRRFLNVPGGSEAIGPVVDDRRVVVAVRHFGDIPVPGPVVRPAVVAVYPPDHHRFGE